MKVRDSGMPDESMWEGFFDPADVLSRLGLTAETSSVADLGCGYGTFTIPAARLIRGTVNGFDIEPEMISETESRAEAESLTNVRLHQRDFVADGTGLPDGSVGLRNSLQHPPRRGARTAARRGTQDPRPGRQSRGHALGQRQAHTTRSFAGHTPKPGRTAGAGWSMQGSRSNGTSWIYRPTTSGSSGERPSPIAALRTWRLRTQA